MTTVDPISSTGSVAGPTDYVSGPLAPVVEEVTAFDLPVTGSLPESLVGRYVRNGPNPVDADPATQHWFLGMGMVHGVCLDGGVARWYRNRWVRSDDVAEFLGEPLVPGPRHGGRAGAVNTNVTAIAGRTMAMVEAGSWPIELTDELETVASTDLDGTLQSSWTAHPHLDPRTGRWHAVTYHWTEEAVRHVVVDDTTARVVHETVVDVGGRPMVHDTAVTATRVLLFDLPCTFDLDSAMAGDPFPYRWDHHRDARVGLLPLDGAADDVVWVEVPRCYVFHPMNAHDLADGRVVVDLCRHPRMFDRDRLGPNEGSPALERWTLDPRTGTSAVEVLDERAQEFPRLDERRTGEPNRLGCTVGLTRPGAAHAPLYLHDLVAGVTEVVDFGPTSAAQEFVVVPRRADADEGDAWLMGLVSDRAAGTTDLVVLAADDVVGGPVARVHLPQRIPDGFHGNWIPDRS
jgi:8'-apo-carotenoid 13,14-cleaving dioxygenase